MIRKTVEIVNPYIVTRYKVLGILIYKKTVNRGVRS